MGTPAASAEPAPLADAPPLLAWLLGTRGEASGQLSDGERHLLAALDRSIHATALPADLLPRAAGVVPQLLALLRRDGLSREAMVEQVVKDMQLTAEVLRLARSPAYGALPIDTLQAAIDRIGSSGVQAATARVLLKPVFGAGGGGLAARAGDRVWQLAEYKSLLCAQFAREAGGTQLDGFLAGLLHDTGTLALLRLADRSGTALPLPPGPAFEAAFAQRRDSLFGRIAADWDIAPVLTRLAQHLGAQPLDTGLPLAHALHLADRCARSELARPVAAA